MDHDDDITVCLKGKLVTGFLIGPVTQVTIMDMYFCLGKACRNFGCIIMTGIIDENDQVHDVLCHHFLIGFFQGFCRVVSWHDYDDFFIFKHGR